MKAASDQLPDPPRALSSEPWSRDYNLTRNYGGTNSTVRSAAEGEIGIYWTEHTGATICPGIQQPGYEQQSGHCGCGPSDGHALDWRCGRGHRVFQRQSTSTVSGGRSPRSRPVAETPTRSPTRPGSRWATTPNHPEYPAAHGCLTGAASTLIADFFGTTRVHIVTDSLAFTDGVHQHVFEDTRDLMDEVFWARMYAGFHFYHSLEAGRQLGETVAQGVVRNHFRAVKSHRDSAGLQ